MLSVSPVDILAQTKLALDELYAPFENTASSVAGFVTSGPQPVSGPTPSQAGTLSGTDKGDVATALWLSYNDVKTNGLWIAYNDSSILGYWNVNGVGSTNTQHMYRPPGFGASSGCPEITTGATCDPSNWPPLQGAAPTSCSAIPTGCQTFHSVNAHGDPTTITKQRSYNTKERGFYSTHTQYPTGQGYWLDKFGSLGYQSSDATVPLLVGYYVAQVLDASKTTTMGVVLIQLFYTSVADILASFNHIGNSVVYIMEAATGELVATSNGEPIFDSTGAQKTGTTASTQLIAASAAHIGSFRATATGEYDFSDTSMGTVAMTATVLDYQRATGSMHHKVVIASYVSSTTGASSSSSDGPLTAAIVTPLMVILVLGLAFLYFTMSKAANVVPMASQGANIELTEKA